MPDKKGASIASECVNCRSEILWGPIELPRGFKNEESLNRMEPFLTVNIPVLLKFFMQIDPPHYPVVPNALGLTCG